MPAHTRLLNRCGVAAVLLAGASAHADTLTGIMNFSYPQQITIDAPGHYVGNVTTMTFGWQRQDSPGAGVNDSIANNFYSYCVDLDQSIPSNTSLTFQAMSLDQVGYTNDQIVHLGRLWSTFQDGVNTSTETAAFQAAVWEIVYDTDRNISTGSFRVTQTNNITSLAQAYLDTVNSYTYSGSVAGLMVLQSSTVQDQITVVPTPAGGLVLGAATLIVLFRRGRPAA